MADSWIHGVGTYPQEVSELRELRRKLAEAEKLLSFQSANDMIDYNDRNKTKKYIDHAFEKSILFGEHTWGLDVKTTLGYNRRYTKKEFAFDRDLPAYRRMEQSWDEQRQRVNQAQSLLEKGLVHLQMNIAGHVEVNEPGLVVFNGLGWERNSWIDLDIYESELKNKSVVDACSGEIIRIARIDGHIKAYIKDLPAMGYKTLMLKETEESHQSRQSIFCKAEEGILENKWYRIIADSIKGGITSLLDKSTGKEWVSEEFGYAFGQYRYDIYGIDDVTEFIRTYTYRFYDWIVNDLGRMSYPPQEHLTFIPDGFSIEAEQGEASASLIMNTYLTDNSTMEYGNAHKISIRISLYEEEPFIDIAFKLNNKEATPFIEAGHFVFPLKLENHEVYINKLGSVVDPAKDILSDANHAVYCCENWVDVSDGENGIAFIPYDTPLFSIGEQAIYKYKRQHEEGSPILFFNAFNNSWGTNFPQWMGGDYVFKYRILPHKGNWKSGDIAKIALETVTPVLIFYSTEYSPAERKISVDTNLLKGLKGMEILAFKPAEDCDGLVLRLREINGEEGQINLTFTRNFSHIIRCDLLERRIKDEKVDVGTLIFMTKPFEIHTFLLEF